MLIIENGMSKKFSFYSDRIYTFVIIIKIIVIILLKKKGSQ